MTAISDLVVLISPFTIVDPDLASYATIAVLKLQSLYPGIATIMDGDLYDYCEALMICHLHQASQGDLDITSASWPDHSYTKGTGQTSYLVELTQTITDWKAGRVAADIIDIGVERADSHMDELKMSQGTLPEYHDTDSVEEYD